MTVPAKPWADRANCLDINPDLMFPNTTTQLAEGKKVCAGCVVRTECLEYALVNNEKFGLWGGTSERERARIQRSRRIQTPFTRSTR